MGKGKKERARLRDEALNMSAKTLLDRARELRATARTLFETSVSARNEGARASQGAETLEETYRERVLKDPSQRVNGSDHNPISSDEYRAIINKATK